jgi:hypothetical protein
VYPLSAPVPTNASRLALSSTVDSSPTDATAKLQVNASRTIAPHLTTASPNALTLLPQ